MKLYLSGPMSGIPKYNFPAFDAAAEHLRSCGHEVISPTDLDRAAGFDPMISETEHLGTWGGALARDVQVMADGGIQGIVVMPGWTTSKGARLEVFLGMLLGLPIHNLEDCYLELRIPTKSLLQMIEISFLRG